MTELPERTDFGDYGEWPGRAVLDPTGRRLGDVREIYLDDATDRPEWVLVELADSGARYVPLADATVDDEAIRVAQTAGSIETAPALEPSKELTQEEERRLYSHYGLRYSEDESDSLLPDPGQQAAAPEAEAAGPEAEAAAPEPATDAAPDPTAAALPAVDVAPQPAASASAGARPRLRRYPGGVPELPAEGDTSEPEDQSPMVPPRPEPVAPSPPPPAPSGPLARLRERPAVAAGVAASLAAIVFIVLRRR